MGAGEVGGNWGDRTKGPGKIQRSSKDEKERRGEVREREKDGDHSGHMAVPPETWSTVWFCPDGPVPQFG